MSNSIAMPESPRLKRALTDVDVAVPSAPRSALAGHLQFVRAFLRDPLTVGAFWPSSRALARLVVEGCQLRSRRLVVELGPGTGAFTELILARLHRKSRFVAIELNATNVRELARRFPHVEIHHDSAANLQNCLGAGGDLRADCIISGLAWANMSPATQEPIMQAITSSLLPGGLFTTFAYVHAVWLPTSQRFRRWLRASFARVETTPIIWRNLPPAFVYRCWKA